MIFTDVIQAFKLAGDLVKKNGDSGGLFKNILAVISDRGIKGARKVARDSTLYFPVIITSGAGSTETVATVMRSIQGFNLGMMALAISNSNIVDLQATDTKLSFLRSLHSNLDLGVGSLSRTIGSVSEDAVDNTTTDVDEIYGYTKLSFRDFVENYEVLKVTVNYENVDVVGVYAEECALMLSENAGIDNKIEALYAELEQCKEKLKQCIDLVQSLNEKIDSLKDAESNAVNSDLKKRIRNKIMELIDERRVTELEIVKHSKHRNSLEKQIAAIEKQRDKLKTAEADKIKKKDETQPSEIALSNTVGSRATTFDEDKLTGIAPAILNAEVVYRHPETGRPEKSSITFGVKTVPHVVTSKDAIHYLSETYKSGNPIFQFIRWSTGELRLVRDIFLNVDRAKFEALSRRKNQNVWGRLRAYTQLGKIRSLIGIFISSARKSPIIPNTTLVMSRVEADTMRIETGVDLLKAPVADKICEKLGFIEIYIVEEDDRGRASALVYTREDGTYTMYSPELLRRSGSKNQMDSRELISLLHR
jgi:hypothetical protein